MAEVARISPQAQMLAEASGPLASRRSLLQDLAEERVNGRVISASQAERLLRATGLSIGSAEDRRQAAAIIRKVEAELAEARMVEVVDIGLDETIARMTARGEEVEDGEAVEAEFIRDRFGAVMRHQGEPMLKTKRGRRISRVDGLRSLHRSGALTDAEVGIANRVRALAEAARPPISSGQINPVRVDGGLAATSDDLVVAAIGRGDASVRLTMIMRAANPYSALLSAVVIEGKSIRTCGEDGNMRRANAGRLKRILATADGLQMVRGNLRLAVLP